MKTLEEIYADATKGDQEALHTIKQWNVYCNAIDDLVDKPERPTPNALIGAFVMAAIVYSTPFYRLNAHLLQPVVVAISIQYAESVSMEQASEQWKRDAADNMRFCGNDFVATVAAICGGFEHSLSIAKQLRERSYADHHDANGKAV